jgi:hypothetical protein
MNLRRWMQEWQAKFGTMHVELLVADVGQSSLVVDVPNGTIVLSPSIKVSAAENMLHKVYSWWRRQPQMTEEHPCSLVSY